MLREIKGIKEIPITEIEGIRIGQAENREAGTGCTVFIADHGMAAGLDVRGGGPASRESELLKPLAAAETIHAVLLSGGSAYGLSAAGGVMQYLEENGIGLPVGDGIVPLVCQSDIFDLTVGDGHVRPDIAMGYAAAKASESGNYRDGNYGAGTGATVGKGRGMSFCTKSGIGSYAIALGKIKIGAVVVVNALGNIYDAEGRVLAGQRNLAGDGFDSVLATMAESVIPQAGMNTTIGIILTNARFTKTQLCKMAGMAHNGYARAIRPVHTSMDGDSIYAVSLGEESCSLDLAGSLSAEVMMLAIGRAVESAESAYGIPCAKEIRKGMPL